MKFVTFNIRCQPYLDGINAFIHRAGMIYDKIQKETPDTLLSFYGGDYRTYRGMFTARKRDYRYSVFARYDERAKALFRSRGESSGRV